jgi:hypothetical protein
VEPLLTNFTLKKCELDMLMYVFIKHILVAALVITDITFIVPQQHVLWRIA